MNFMSLAVRMKFCMFFFIFSVGILIIDPLKAQELDYSHGFGAPDPYFEESIVGADGRGIFTGPGTPEGGFDPVIAASDGEVPIGIKPLEIDLFTTKDFYSDSVFWSDPRYFRCNSPLALEAQWGATQTPVIGENPPYSAAWGYCDRDYPREEIVSPYPFTTAKEHYESLLKNRQSSQIDPLQDAQIHAEWNGHYRRQHDKRSSWYDGSNLQITTYLSLLTPKYQQYFVQQMFHYGNTNAGQWPGAYCWPEGFMRRLSHYGGIRGYLMITPDMVEDMRWGATNMAVHINLNRSFNEVGALPRLGADTPRWYGETVGFWDEDNLITWTSNIQGWFSHGSFEFSNKMQSIEIYSALNNKVGEFTGLRHEVILYDSDALVVPVRIVHYLDKTRDLNEGDPYEYVQCLRTIYPINGIGAQITPGQTIEFTQPDFFDRPWAQYWESQYEEGMHRPNEETLFDFSN